MVEVAEIGEVTVGDSMVVEETFKRLQRFRVQLLFFVSL